eukprot:scaffold22742_cov139-Cylindrotheca_fusiformis.AAC.11
MSTFLELEDRKKIYKRLKCNSPYETYEHVFRAGRVLRPSFGHGVGGASETLHIPISRDAEYKLHD